MQQFDVSIIGAGAVGKALARALNKAGISIKGIYNRHENVAASIAGELGIAYTGSFPENNGELGKVIFLTVSDPHIEKTAQQVSVLAENFGGHIVAHCSGTKTSAALKALQQKEAAAASFHPIQTFTDASEASDFNGITIDLEGDRRAVNYLKNLCSSLNCKSLEIKAAAKSYLHAAAVMTSNYLVALMEGTMQIAELGEISKETALMALMPLLKKSVENISSGNQLSEALSGPIARGDAATVQNHLNILEGDQQLQILYAQLGRILVPLAQGGNAISEQQANKILQVLDSFNDDN